MTLTHYFVMCSAICLMICISTHGVMHVNKYWIIVMDTNTSNDTNDFVKTSQRMLFLGQCLQHRRSQTDTNTMLNVLQNSVLFDQFMGHLIKEFSIEIMLSLIEMSQFQQSVREFAEEIHEFEYDDNMEPMDPEWRVRVTAEFPIYPSCIPHSAIVWDDLNKGEVALCRHLGIKNDSLSADTNYSNGFGIRLDTYDDDYDGSERVQLEGMNSRNRKSSSINLRSRKSSSVTANIRNSTSVNIRSSTEIEVKKIELLIRSHKLYAKYIEKGSVLEMNLTQEQKGQMIGTMRGFNEWVNMQDNDGNQLKMLFQLFEKTMEEMFTILNASFIRFKSKYSLTDFNSRSP
eukprot:265351_1